MTPPIEPRQGTAIEAIADSVLMKLLGLGLFLLGAYLLVRETVPFPPETTARQSTVDICIFAGLIVLGAALSIGARFVNIVANVGGAVAKFPLPWGRRKDDVS